jgi:tetratricopeptide (TPR) repeat protein
MNLNKEINQINNHFSSREFKKVVSSCEKIIQSKIENTIIYNLYGLGLQKMGSFDKSIRAFENSIQLQKNNFIAINNLAVSLKAINEIKLSEKAYQNCLKIKPDYLIAILNYAKLKEESNDPNGSLKLYHKALELKTEANEIYIFSKLSDLYQSLGNFEEGKHYAKEIIKTNPESIHGHVLFSKFVDYKIDNSHLVQMEEIFNKKRLNNNEIIELSFAIGLAYEKQKNYKKSFKFFNQGNNFKSKLIKYDSSDSLRLQQSIIDIFEKIKGLNIKKSYSERKIIFVCGMPRSGTTLIEQIISSHSEVMATGENNYLSGFVKNNYLDNFTLSEEKIFKDIYLKENIFQDSVLKSLNNHNFDSKVLTDKSVQNFFWIGFIRYFFPNSKIIVTERNPKDICLSIFKINFASGFMNFAYNQKDIAEFYNLYIDLMKYWKKLFPSQIYTINYENLIKNSEDEIKKLINFCDLEWDEKCLKHDKNKSIIKTASTFQARKPIYNSSINLSDNYSEYLSEMFDLIEN